MLLFILVPFLLLNLGLPFPLLRRPLLYLPSVHSSLQLFLGSLLRTVAGSRRDVHQNQRIADEVALDEMIKRRFSGETWSVVDF